MKKLCHEKRKATVSAKYKDFPAVCNCLNYNITAGFRAQAYLEGSANGTRKQTTA